MNKIQSFVETGISPFCLLGCYDPMCLQQIGEHTSEKANMVCLVLINAQPGNVEDVQNLEMP